ncbi:MAG: alanine dehydrogenase [Gammaproteobacteria bacterium]|nr:alanine dehydrogenase [Gammaproteobacteria bacterium]MCI0591170.1 alanine dehydrogenase [Gammaproteobacteria bacterium]
MKIGVPREIKDKENRVALTPAGARTLVGEGHIVQIQQGAGRGSGFSDEEFRRAGADIVSVETAWDAEMVMKIKEPLESEYQYFKGQIIFTYFHLAGVPEALTEALLATKTTAVAYETVEDNMGKLPLLAPMSAVAGNMAATMGSHYLAKFNNGKGIQLGTVLGVRYGKVVIIGDGVVGRHAAKTADGMGANVFIVGRHKERARELKDEISNNVTFVESTSENIAREIKDADLVIGAVLLHGERAPCLVTEAMVERMQPGSVIVDVSIDQGGCIETARPTSHTQPVYEKHNIIHYCVTNMPGAYPRTSTIALTSTTLPYAVTLARRGVQALRDDTGFGRGLNTYKGYITYKPVAKDLNLMSRYKAFDDIKE